MKSPPRKYQPYPSDVSDEGFQERSGVGYFAPAGNGAAVVKRLNDEINRSLSLADVRTYLDNLGLEPKPLAPAEFAGYVETEVSKWAKIVKTTGITAD